MYIVEQNVSLQRLNTYGLKVIARYFIVIRHESDLVEIFSDQLVTDIDRKLILGGGSNLLFVDDYFNGLIIYMSIKGFYILPNEEKASKIILKVGAGEKWTDLIEYTIKHGYSGLEYLAGIPGTVGGAPVQNIGAYGAELSDVFVECQVFDTQKKCFIRFDKDTCRFAYRNSIFKEINLHTRYIITDVTFELSKSLSTDMKLQSENTVKDILHRRSVKLPDPWLDVGNAGSFFANPIIKVEQYEALKQQEAIDIPFYSLQNNQRKLLAGWLIEQCQWKGKSLGSAGTWHLHANVLINNQSKDGSDLWELAKKIRMSVEKRFRIRLEPEVYIIRKFIPIKVCALISLIRNPILYLLAHDVIKTNH